MSNYSSPARLPSLDIPPFEYDETVRLHHYTISFLFLSVSLCLALPWRSSAFFLPHLLCFIAMIKGTLTLKHDRVTPTPTTTVIWKKIRGKKKITPVLLYTQRNFGVTFLFYHIFLGSQNSVAVSPGSSAATTHSFTRELQSGFAALHLV